MRHVLFQLVRRDAAGARGAMADDEGRQDEGQGGLPRRWRRPSKATIAIFVTVAAVGLVIGFLDFGKAWTAVKGGDLSWVAWSLAASIGSYLFLAASYGWIFGRMGIRVPPTQLMIVGYTSSALNNLMPMPSLAGHGIRVALLRDRGVSPGDTLAASAFHSYLSSFVLLLFLPIGLGLIVVRQDLPDAAEIPLGTLAALTFALLAGMTWVMFTRDLRRMVLDRVGRIFGRFVRHRDVAKNLEDFENTIERGVLLLKRRRGSLAIAVALDIGDWALTALTLYAGFLAFGYPLEMGVLLTGFVVGVVVGLQSLIPGGLGVQEASMAGVYALLGVPFHIAVLAALLFRVTYHIVPFGGALVGYARLMHRPLHLEDLRRARQDVQDEG